MLSFRVIHEIRSSEIACIQKTAYFVTLPAVTSAFVPMLVTLVTFTAYSFTLTPDSQHILSVDRVFFCLALFNYMRISLNVIPRFIGLVVNAIVAIRRIEDFLSSPDRVPFIKCTPNHLDNDKIAISMEKAILSWNQQGVSSELCRPSSDSFILTIPHLQIPIGSLVAVAGPVGSGKSSFICALLQDMHLLSGSIQMSPKVRSIAYVPQQAWIMNRTFRENILFGKEYDDEKYHRIVTACELDQDVSRMPAGHSTEIGEHGVNLSGGQKQRMAIARACYADADLYLLDDPLSAVDAHVARQLLS